MQYRTNRNTKSTQPILLMLVMVRKRVRPSVIICFLFSAKFRNKAWTTTTGQIIHMHGSQHDLYLFLFFSAFKSHRQTRKLKGRSSFQVQCCTNIHSWKGPLSSLTNMQRVIPPHKRQQVASTIHQGDKGVQLGLALKGELHLIS